MTKKVILASTLIFSLAFGSKNAPAGMEGIGATNSNISRYLSGTAYIGETAKAEQIYTEISQRDLLRKQPPPKLDWSLEREQLIRRIKLWNDVNKQAYIYLFTQGRLVGFYAIKGKVSSVNSMLTNPEMVYGSSALPSPDLDGSYGSNGDAVFFFLTDGTYVEWNGQYFLSDRPMKLNVEPMMVNMEK